MCDFNAPDEDNWTFKVFHDEAERLKMAALMTQVIADVALDKGATTARSVRINFYNQLKNRV